MIRLSASRRSATARFRIELAGRGARRLALGLALLLMAAVPAAAQAGSAPALAGSVNDSTNLASTVAVAVSGHYAYTSAYSAGELTAVDISNPAAPVITGGSAPFLDGNLIGGSNVTISGGYAFVVSKNRNSSTSSNDDGNGNSLSILDVHSNPAVPSLVGTIRDTGKLFGSYGVAVFGHYAYVAYQGVLSGQPSAPDTSGGGFSVIDIANPAGPTIVANLDNGSLPSPWTGTNALQHATSVALSSDGHYAYVNAFYGYRVSVIDISTPSNPRIVGSAHNLSLLAYPVDIAVQGNYLFVADQTGGSSDQLTVVDVSNPTAPHVVAEISDNADLGGAYRIRVRGNFAYISASSVNAVAAVDISDPLHPRVAGSLIDNGHLHRTTGLDLDPSGAYVVASSPYLSTQVNSTYPPYPLQSGGPTATGTISVIQIDPNPIAASISSAPSSLTASTSASFAFAASDSVAIVRCSLDGGPAVPCTSPNSQVYSGLGVGNHSFLVQATDAAGNTSSASYNWQIGTAPANSGAPSIDAGPATVGQTVNLTATGTWSGSPAPSFGTQWERCDQAGANCAPITGETGNSYVVQAADAGSTLAAAVTGSNGLGSSTASSASTAIVTGPPVNTAVPAISGIAAVGQTLSASSGSWNGYPAPGYTYAWQDCSGSTCTPNGGTGPSYSVQAGDAGSSLEVIVTASNGIGTPGTASSAQTAMVGGSAPQNTSAPTIDAGSVTAGQTVSLVSNGTWTGAPAPTFTYQWERCDPTGANCVPITGQSSTSYTTGRADGGATIELQVTGTNGSGGQSAMSAPTGVVTVSPANTSIPTIAGNAVVGSTLTASPGNWSGYPAPSFAYQWSSCGTSGCSSITGAQNASYTVQSADAGSTLKVTVTATNPVGSAAADSDPSSTVTAAPANSKIPTISGTRTQGATLTVSPGTWSGTPAPTFTYQWNRCNASGGSCAAISGATSQSYVPQRADVGQTLRATVTGANSAGTSSASSTLTNPITGPPADTVAPTVSGSPTQGSTLTATLGTWTGYPAPTLAVQWQRCISTGCSNVSGATTTSYTLTAADVGAQFRVTVTGTNSVGAASKNSNLTTKVSTSVSATMAGVRHAPKLKIVLRRLAGAEQITVSLPSGYRFVKALAVLRHGVSVRDAHGHLLHVTLALRVGRLTIRLDHFPIPVHIALRSGTVLRR